MSLSFQATAALRNEDGSLGDQVLIEERGLATYGLIADFLAIVGAYPGCGQDVHDSVMLSAEAALREWEPERACAGAAAPAKLHVRHRSGVRAMRALGLSLFSFGQLNDSVHYFVAAASSSSCRGPPRRSSRRCWPGSGLQRRCGASPSVPFAAAPPEFRTSTPPPSPASAPTNAGRRRSSRQAWRSVPAPRRRSPETTNRRHCPRSPSTPPEFAKALTLTVQLRPVAEPSAR